MGLWYGIKIRHGVMQPRESRGGGNLMFWSTVRICLPDRDIWL